MIASPASSRARCAPACNARASHGFRCIPHSSPAFALLAFFLTSAATAQIPPTQAGSAPDPDSDPPHPTGVDAGALDATIAPDSDTQVADAPIGASSQIAPVPPGRVWNSCTERIPENATRPEISESFPTRAFSGYAVPLRIEVKHGRGESVFPTGVQVQRESDAGRALVEAGFVVPNPDGGSGPTIVRKGATDQAVTEIILPFVALPPTPGRHALILPPIPVTVARASGELITLCTSPHEVVVEDPIANEPHPSPQANPQPRPQRELWTLARDLTYGALLAAPIAALLTALALWWRRRPRPTPPPPPPRPPWETAIEELDLLRRSSLLSEGQAAEFVDRVSDTLRRYLGALYGFDGIESTTDEVLRFLSRLTPTARPAAAAPLPLTGIAEPVRSLLERSDLVKFARWSPTESDCLALLDQAEAIVRQTMPAPTVSPAPPAGGGS